MLTKRNVAILAMGVVGVLWAAGLGTMAYARMGSQTPNQVGAISGDPHVDAALQRACYDCHSNATRWPWYSYLPGAGMLVAVDTLRGRGALNFSNWPTMPLGARDEALGESAEAVAEGEMPPRPYRTMHPDAALTPQEVAAFQAFAGEGGEGGEGDEGDDDDDDESGAKGAGTPTVAQTKKQVPMTGELDDDDDDDD